MTYEHPELFFVKHDTLNSRISQVSLSRQIDCTWYPRSWTVIGGYHALVLFSVATNVQESTA